MTSVQATVKDWTPGVGGSAFRDDGSTIALPAECLRESVFRFLRIGQRIQVELEDDVALSVGLP